MKDEVAFMGAPGTRAGVTLPKLGSWELTLRNAPGQGDFKVRVTFVRREGDRIYGVLEYARDGPSMTLEVFSATVDPTTGVVRLDGRVEHTKAEGLFPGRYQGKLSLDGRELSDFHATGIASTGVTGNMKWASDELPTYSPTVVASMSLSDERSLLYQQFSANYVLQSISVRHGPDRPLIKELSQSKEKYVRDLAELKMAFQDMYEQAMTKDAKEAQEWVKDDLARRAKIFLFVAEAFRDPSEQMQNPVADVLNSLGLKKAFDRRRAAVEIACIQMIVMNHVRAKVKADYMVRNPGNQSIGRGKFAVGFKVNSAGRCVAMLRNNTSGDLHNSFVATKMTVNQTKLDQYLRQVQGNDNAARLLSMAVGVDFKIVRSIDNSQDVLFKYFRLEKGLPVFIPLWPKGAVLEVEVGMPGDILYIASSVGTWLGSDEGSAEISLDLNELKRTILSRPR